MLRLWYEHDVRPSVRPSVWMSITSMDGVQQKVAIDRHMTGSIGRTSARHSWLPAYREADLDAGVKFSGSWWELGSHTSNLSSHTLHTGSHISHAGSHTRLSSSLTSIYSSQTNMCKFAITPTLNTVHSQRAAWAPEPAGCIRSWPASVELEQLILVQYRHIRLFTKHSMFCWQNMVLR